MSSYPPPPPYQPPGAPPPQFPHFPQPPRPRAAGGDVALKVLIGSAVGMGVGFGMCGLGAVFSGANQKAVGFAIAVGAFLFFASLLGLIVSAIWLLVAAIVEDRDVEDTTDCSGSQLHWRVAGLGHLRQFA